MKKGGFMNSKLIILSFTIGFTSILTGGTTGKIAGEVTDNITHEPLIGVNVYLEGTNLGTATDINGEYIIINIPPGEYTLKATMMGYKIVRLKNIRVSVDRTTEVNIEMTTTVIEGEVVELIAKKPLVQNDLTSSEVVINAEEIQELPVENFDQILNLQAGVIKDSEGELHIRGGRSSEISYLVDGISVTDPFSSSMPINFEKNAIKEMQVVTGTYNAEYGQAMSGIVNIVTQKGQKKFDGEISLYGGDYFTSHKDIFFNIQDAGNDFIEYNIHDFTHPNLNNYDIQGSFSGPLNFVSKNLTFFLTARHYNNQGYLYGRRIYMPDDSCSFNTPNRIGWRWEHTGDSSLVIMDYNIASSCQGNISYSYSPLSMKIEYTGIFQRKESQSYVHDFKYTPDGKGTNYQFVHNHILTLTHTLNNRIFYTLKYSYLNNDSKYYKYKNPLDHRYVSPLRFNAASGYRFYVGGCDMNHLYQNTKRNIVKFDITNQINKTNEIKTGIEYDWNYIFYNDFEIRVDAMTNWEPEVPNLNSPNHDKYNRSPNMLSCYLQDKLELQNMIINIGVRYERFWPNGVVLSDPRDPNINLPIKQQHQTETYEERLKHWYQPATPKDQVSPRFGISYPITDKGIIHFSYGHFLQIPNYSYLYSNPDFEVTGGLNSIIGNADLKPEKTVSYEIGLQQQLTESLAIDVIGFYKDIRNLIGTEIIETYIMGDRYARYINRDYGNVRGITLSFEQRRSNFLSARLDYTYQVAEGNASDPKAAFYDVRSGVEPVKQLVYLDWDQTHTLNTSITLGVPKKWGLSIIGQYGSGKPYTPMFRGIRTMFENSERKPPQYRVDLRSHYDLYFYNINVSIFLLVYNLFDRLNEEIVYNDTGRANYSLIPTYTGNVYGPNTLDEYLVRPHYFSSPREIKIGINIEF